MPAARSSDPRPTNRRDPITEARRQWEAHGWAEAADGMELVTSLVRAHQLVMERIDTVLRPLDLSFARYEVLRLLSFTRDGAMPMTRLGSLLQVHPTSVTSAVARLVKQGYATRERGAHDGRVVLASITETGREVIEQATQRLNAEVFASPGISPEETAQLTALLGALRRAAGDDVAPSATQ
ncbi:MarR family winged helix-turn-helix transcriptional regulator [Nocardioides jishulii]|uniref:MarR family transcriptional regulator n=1 Tax=Nocardioides jishulii TaxID=2575440 RepID=A0A4U2YQM6_9ACTN|nr:MarR family transcriptional regulator [Nocardioides jishulii]QCX26545.1 MarR family transcriptional regulator [Nocardioides jishulii]TKI63648.1 MarR family transcriptional regulator [Nocardioides jishulii]